MAALVLSACTQEIESDPVMNKAAVDRIRLSSTTPGSSLENRYQTYLYSERDVDVYSRLIGISFLERGAVVKAIYREIGDHVKAGQLLVTLEDDEAALALEVAKARADEAQAKFERVEGLRDLDVVAPAEYDEALYAHRRAQAELKRAELELSRTRVRAPFAGVVSRRYVRVGELVEDEAPLFRITTMSPLRARLLVPESQAVAFNVGAPVRLTGAGSQTATARVIIMGQTIDPASGTREVILELSETSDFRPGASVIAEPMSAKGATNR